jgi:predicted enzyme related to lactoylglutathione lyase
MRWRGVNHLEFAVLDYDDSIAFYDTMFCWLGYSSFSSLNMEFQSSYYMFFWTRDQHRTLAPIATNCDQTSACPLLLSWPAWPKVTRSCLTKGARGGLLGAA